MLNNQMVHLIHWYPWDCDWVNAMGVIPCCSSHRSTTWGTLRWCFSAISVLFDPGVSGWPKTSNTGKPLPALEWLSCRYTMCIHVLSWSLGSHSVIWFFLTRSDHRPTDTAGHSWTRCLTILFLTRSGLGYEKSCVIYLTPMFGRSNCM